MHRSPCTRNTGRGLSPVHHSRIFTTLPILVILTWITWLPSSVQAQASGYSFGVDLPLQFVFTGDLSGAVSTSGFKITLDTPYNVGIGYENYSVDASDTDTNIFTTVEYQFYDLFVDIYFPVMHLALGYGFGTVTFEPFKISGIELSSDEIDSDQWFLAFGWPLTPSWEVHFGYHRVSAEADLAVNGVKTDTTLDLGGIMHSLGLKYIF